MMVMSYIDWYRRFAQILIQYLFWIFDMNLFPISSCSVIDSFSGYIARRYLWQLSLLIMYECQLKLRKYILYLYKIEFLCKILVWLYQSSLYNLLRILFWITWIFPMVAFWRSTIHLYSIRYPWKAIYLSSGNNWHSSFCFFQCSEY